MTAPTLLDAATSVVVPPRCGICASACDWRALACPRCLRAIEAQAPVDRALPGLDQVVAAAPYQGAARRLVAALKFGPRPRLAGLAGLRLASVAARLDPGWESAALVPVPPAPARLRRRGHDTAAAIAAAAGSRLEIALEPRLRRRGAARQLGRSRRRRIADPPRVACVAPFPGRAILVDDVVTTGSTLAACARALRGAGAVRVDALVVAAAVPAPRGPRRAPERGSLARASSRYPG